jgi:hypothetical protein
MSIFISYKTDDRDRALRFRQAIATATSRPVWWDQDLRYGGEWTQDLDKALSDARGIIVLWTPRSIASAWVLQEAAIGRAEGKLIPVLLEECVVPDAFRAIQTADLRNWNGDDKATEFQRLAADVEKAFAQSLPAPAKPKPKSKSKSKRPMFVAVVLAAALSAGVTYVLTAKTRVPPGAEDCRDALARLSTTVDMGMDAEALRPASKEVLTSCNRVLTALLAGE